MTQANSYDRKIAIKRKIDKKLSKVEKQQIEQDYDIEVFEKLRQYRLELSQKHKIPPFIIFADSSLKQIATKLPTTKEEQYI